MGSAQPPGPPPPPAKPLLRVLGPDGKELRVFEVKAGANLRKTLQAQKLDVYEFISKLTNCNGACMGSGWGLGHVVDPIQK